MVVNKNKSTCLDHGQSRASRQVTDESHPIVLCVVMVRGQQTLAMKGQGSIDLT